MGESCSSSDGSVLTNSVVIPYSLYRAYVTLGDFHVCSTCTPAVLKEIWKTKGSEINLQEVFSKSRCYVPRTFDGGVIKELL